MSAIGLRVRPTDVSRARLAYAHLLLQTGCGSTHVCGALQKEFGLSERTAFRVLRRIRLGTSTDSRGISQ
jgi:hypothetical protein